MSRTQQLEYALLDKVLTADQRAAMAKTKEQHERVVGIHNIEDQQKIDLSIMPIAGPGHTIHKKLHAGGLREIAEYVHGTTVAI